MMWKYYKKRGAKVTTIHGTSGNDVITGTDGLDIINGVGGDDATDGLGGNDVICFSCKIGEKEGGKTSFTFITFSSII